MPHGHEFYEIRTWFVCDLCADCTSHTTTHNRSKLRKGPVTQAQRTNYVLIANKLRFLREFYVIWRGVVRDVQSAHESRTDRVRTALIALETR